MVERTFEEIRLNINILFELSGFPVICIWLVQNKDKCECYRTPLWTCPNAFSMYSLKVSLDSKIRWSISIFSNTRKIYIMLYINFKHSNFIIISFMFSWKEQDKNVKRVSFKVPTDYHCLLFYRFFRRRESHIYRWKEQINYAGEKWKH